MSTGATNSQTMVGGALTTNADAIAAAKARLAERQAAATGAATQQSQQGPVIQSGVTIASTINGLENGKTYFHRVPGARCVLPDGREIVFMGGQFSTSDPAIIAELDAVANSHTSMIFTERGGTEYAKSLENKLATEAGETVGDNKPV